MPEFRKDPITGRWVIISSERAKRPQPRSFGHPSVRLEVCPFCAGHEEETPPEVMAYRKETNAPDRPGWTVRVVPNKYPAVVANTESHCSDGFYESRPGIGVHEVVIESPEHVLNMAMLEPRQLTAVLHAYRARMLDLRRDKRWRYILVYKNEGAEAGATLEHVHSQLIALPEVPQEVLNEIEGARRYYESTGCCLYCAIINRETGNGQRLVAESTGFIVLCPYAARFPFETWILPKSHSPLFDRCSDEHYADLSRCLRETLERLDRGLDKPPFNYVIHSAPIADNTDDLYHWHMEILPKLTQAAGFEWGSGSFINPISPEDAARILRDIVL